MRRPKGRGRIWTRGEEGFDDAVLATSFNARDNGARPDMLIEANDTSDVIKALAHARKKNWQVSICSGGHSWAQNHLREWSITQYGAD